MVFHDVPSGYGAAVSHHGRCNSAILKDGVCHVVILPDLFFISTGFPLLMILKFDIASDPVPFEIHQILFTAVAASLFQLELDKIARGSAFINITFGSVTCIIKKYSSSRILLSLYSNSS